MTTQSNTVKNNKYATQNQTIICSISGIATTIVAPKLPALHGISYHGLHPFANVEVCQELSRMRYSESHIFLAPTILAGAILSILHHLELRHDNVSAQEANALLSTLPPFTLSKILTFAGTLAPYHAKRIPSLSFEDRDPTTLIKWHQDCEDAFASSIAERQYYKEVEVKKIKTKESPKLAETRKRAHILFQTLKDMEALPFKLSNVLNTILHKDYLLTMSADLRTKVCAALHLLDIPESHTLAGIIEDAPNIINRIDKMKANIFDSEIERVSDLSEYKPKTLAEIIASAKAKQEDQRKTDNADNANNQEIVEDADAYEDAEDDAEDDVEYEDINETDDDYDSEDADDIKDADDNADIEDEDEDMIEDMLDRLENIMNRKDDML